ncbi:MAG: hypothetical protein M3Z23_16010 [Acidobacteriota bacterium]|nr:hypothetical protein [Acidobacteriota bacterium]
MMRHLAPIFRAASLVPAQKVDLSNRATNADFSKSAFTKHVRVVSALPTTRRQFRTASTTVAREGMAGSSGSPMAITD